jgi:cytochrome c-type biogenesis protein CcmH
MTLWIILTALTAICAAVLTIPLVRRQEARIDAQTATIAVLKDQLADVDVQLAAGTIPPGDAEGLRIEIKRRMLAAGHIPEDAVKTMGSRALGGVAIGLAAMVALAAGALYSSMGKPGMGGMGGASVPVAAPQQAAAAADPAARNSEVAGLIGALEAKMVKSPNDPEGWRMLGWSYFQTERFADAATAYGKAIALKPDGPGYQSAYGEALALAANGNINPEARAAFEKAVMQDHNDARARFFLGQAKAQSNDAKGAIADWLALLGDSAGDAPWVPQLRAMLAQTAQAAGIDITARLAAIKPPTSGGASVAAPPEAALAGAAAAAAAIAPGPSADQVAGAAAMSPADRQAMISSMVDRLATRLAANPRDEAGWLRLIRARSVMGDAAATRKARDDALNAFADDAAATARIKAAASEAGL